MALVVSDIPEVVVLCNRIGEFFKDINDQSLVEYRDRYSEMDFGIYVHLSTTENIPTFPDEVSTGVMIVACNFSDSRYMQLFALLASNYCGFIKNLTMDFFMDPRYTNGRIAQYNFLLSVDAEVPEALNLSPQGETIERINLHITATNEVSFVRA